MTNMMETLTKEEIIATMEMVIAELNSGREHSEKEINLLNTIVKNSRRELQRRMIKDGKLLKRFEGECDNGHYEVLHILYTNGVDFIVYILNGKVFEIT